MSLSSVNPFIRYAGVQMSLPRTTGYTRCYDCRLFFVEEGEGSILIEGNYWSMKEDTAIFVPPGTRYHFRFDTPVFRLCVFNFDLTDEFSYMAESLGAPAEEDYDEKAAIPHPAAIEPFTKVHVIGGASFLSEVHTATKLFLTKPAYYREKASALLKLCLFTLAEKSEPGANLHPVVRSVCDYLREHYAEPELTNDVIAEQFGYHPYYLSGLFRQTMGMPLHRYLLSYRLKVAKNFLAATDYGISDVCWRCGFTSLSYFIRRFREETGQTPAHYRRTHLPEGI